MLIKLTHVLIIHTTGITVKKQFQIPVDKRFGILL